MLQRTGRLGTLRASRDVRVWLVTRYQPLWGKLIKRGDSPNVNDADSVWSEYKVLDQAQTGKSFRTLPILNSRAAAFNITHLDFSCCNCNSDGSYCFCKMAPSIAASNLHSVLAQMLGDPQLPRENPTTSFWQIPPHPNVSATRSVKLSEKTSYAIIGSGVTGCSVANNLLIYQLQARSPSSKRGFYAAVRQVEMAAF